jgi:ribosomal protein L17
MRKRIKYRQLNMDSAHRWSVLRNLATSLIYHERIMTTTPKAKELRRVAEKLVTVKPNIDMQFTYYMFN